MIVLVVIVNQASTLVDLVTNADTKKWQKRCLKSLLIKRMESLRRSLDKREGLRSQRGVERDVTSNETS
jgi:hypothetical protein